jgi:diguanylate cyclase (GGDEF)-like protein
MEPAVRTRATERPDASAARKDRRLRALYRRELQNSIHLSAWVVAAAAAIAAAWSFLAGIELGLLSLSVTGPIILISVAIAGLVKLKGRHRVVELGMILGILPIVAASAAVLRAAPSAPVALGAVGVIPLAFAVFVPLERKPHVVWLTAADAIYLTALLLMIAPPSPLHSDEAARPAALLWAAGLGTVVSLIANEIELRRRGQTNGQLLAVRALYGRMKEHELDLRRQDEFLFMQQETLVVQQAELLRLNEELETIARLDALTGLGNRLRLNEDLAQLAGRIERSGGTAGLLLMDLDRFKRLNDTAGHLAGDAALRGVSDVLRKTSRVGDGLYRYGGEEFLVVLHDCDETVLRSAGQRYVSAIEAAGMSHPDNPPYGVVTASAGAVTLSQANCVDIDVALHDADEALYVAKARGRNRLEVQTHPHQSTFSIDQQRAAS